jgi:hypothetical protein
MKRSIRFLSMPLATSVAVAAGMMVVASPAYAATLPVINVHESASGFTVSGAPLNRRAGRVELHFSATTVSANGNEVDLVKLRPGKTVAELAQAIAKEPSNTPSVAAAGTREIVADALAFGGSGLNLPGQTASVTETLYAGTYYLIDVGAATSGKKAQSMAVHVSGRPSTNDWPGSAATIVMGAGSADRFASPAVLPAGKNWLIRNTGDTIHFIQFLPVKPGTTDSQLQKLFTSNDPNAVDPTTGPGLSTGVVSPGSQIVFTTSSLAPGTYAMVCFIAGDVTGMPHALMGMHLVVTIK